MFQKPGSNAFIFDSGKGCCGYTRVFCNLYYDAAIQIFRSHFLPEKLSWWTRLSFREKGWIEPTSKLLKIQSKLSYLLKFFSFTHKSWNEPAAVISIASLVACRSFPTPSRTFTFCQSHSSAKATFVIIMSQKRKDKLRSRLSSLN